MMLLIKDLPEWQGTRRSPVFSDKSVGFVPTMGNLHEGHSSLLRRARLENDISVLSIFVNAPQFDDLQDLERYPRTFEADLEVAEAKKVDYVLAPSYEQLYPDDYHYRVSESFLSRQLCGKVRPGHFEGVLTIVMKLIMLVRPHRCYFGEKDFQQLRLVQGMVSAFFLDTEVVSCPTVRETDGLALSSRNRHLSASQRKLAAEFPRILTQDVPPDEIVRDLRHAGFEVEYVEDLWGRRFGAVRLGPTRLIDNVPLEAIRVTKY